MNFPFKSTLPLFLSIAAIVFGTSSAEASSRVEYAFQWTPLPDFPESTGLKGFYVLDTGDTHLLMGGSFFPKGPGLENSKKAYSSKIYCLMNSDCGEARWNLFSQCLPTPMAEGVSIPFDGDSILIGGRNEDTVLDQVIRISWEKEIKAIRFERLPSLPESSFFQAGTAWKSRIYIAGGYDGTDILHTFQMLDLKKKPMSWRKLPPWPGPPLFGATLEVLNDGHHDYLYLFSGKSGMTTPRSQDNYSRAVFRFDPVKECWESMAEMPRAALLGISMKINDSILAILGGSDGHDIERLDEIGEAYRLPGDILVYSALNNQWQIAGMMPLGVAGAPLMRTSDGFILASGEYSPAVRTEKVFHVKVEEICPQ